ncbi:hypothetical protein GTO89_05010 [Heliobacterium gestii]|uniref:PduH protein n=1 Tax=Heliomicrobium gestii TaxID=2699 RepID=A0A845L9Z0_HELGE|nr:glycerol dehydratase reactivase beta/small subunit family protein [Heliomicrobium gestii]MBM7866978.1 hypothetical protein [Heliomicrobium gestii]MZP42401.1 hypothetical protein [Heliomicrobium gestii]
MSTANAVQAATSASGATVNAVQVTTNVATTNVAKNLPAAAAMAAERAPAKPSVLIFYAPHDGCPQKLRELHAGLEEEGIPAAAQVITAGALEQIAYQAAQTSQLGVGISVIGGQGMCIHHRRLPENRPLFVLDETARPADWRRLGYNAARLVKGTAFKLETDDEPASRSGKNAATGATGATGAAGRAEASLRDIADSTMDAMPPGAEEPLDQVIARIVAKILAEQGPMQGKATNQGEAKGVNPWSKMPWG